MWHDWTKSSLENFCLALTNNLIETLLRSVLRHCASLYGGIQWWVILKVWVFSTTKSAILLQKASTNLWYVILIDYLEALLRIKVDLRDPTKIRRKNGQRHMLNEQFHFPYSNHCSFVTDNPGHGKIWSTLARNQEVMNSTFIATVCWNFVMMHRYKFKPWCISCI